MKLRLVRNVFTEKSTIGDFSIDGGFFCRALEDKDRLLEVHGCKAKVYRETCIQRGTYKVIIDFSQHFQRFMPHIMDVPCFEGIRIHIGNRPDDTEGCVLLGTSIEGSDFISHSADAFNAFFNLLKTAIAAGETITLEVA